MKLSIQMSPLQNYVGIDEAFKCMHEVGADQIDFGFGPWISADQIRSGEHAKIDEPLEVMYKELEPYIAAAKKYGVEVVLFCDTNHVLYSDYATVRTIGAGADAVDFALTAECKKGDIVITQDYGLAAMALAKGAHILNQNGSRYTNENIDSLLMSRHIGKKIRRAGGRTKGPSKRTKEQDERFVAALEALLRQLLA